MTELSNKINTFISKQRKYERHPEKLVPKKVTEQVTRGGKTFARERTILVKPQEIHWSEQARKEGWLHPHEMSKKINDAIRVGHDMQRQMNRLEDSIHAGKKDPTSTYAFGDVSDYFGEFNEERAKHLAKFGSEKDYRKYIDVANKLYNAANKRDPELIEKYFDEFSDLYGYYGR